MIRKLAVAGIGLLLLAGSASAITKATRTCVATERLNLRKCTSDCRAAFSLHQAECFGPGVECAKACQSNDSDQNPGLAQCQAPINADKSLCLNGPADKSLPDTTSCAAKQKAALAQCGVTDDQCKADANSAALACRLKCNDDAAPALANCNSIFNNCLQACASKPS